MKINYSERQLIRQIQKYSCVILYGAGMVGELTCQRLLACGLKEKILGFAVTERRKNSTNDRFCDFAIYEIGELESYKNEALVIVTTLPNLHEDIKKTLLELQFDNIIFVTRKLYKSFENHYIQNFRKKNKTALFSDSKTKILFMASDNNKNSGAFLCMTELCEQLLKKGIGVGVVLPNCGTGAFLLEERNIPYTYIKSRDWAYKEEDIHKIQEKFVFITEILSNYKAKWELISLLKKYHVDLVHCNTTYTYIGAVAAKHCGIPFVWHLRENLEHQGYKIFFQKQAWKLIQQAGKVIAVSQYIKNIVPFKNEKLIDVIYDAVGIRENEYFQRKILCEKNVQMILVGILIQYKGQRDLIEACHILKGRGITDFHVLLVGKEMPDYVEKLHHLIKKYGLESNISFYGTSDNVYSLLAQSDISFMCSSREAYGRVTIESQLSGCLVIGVDSGATPELIEEQKTGYLYKTGDIQSLAEKIVEAISDVEKSRKIAKDGQIYAQRTYTKEKNVQQIINIYEEVLGRTV